MYHSLSGRGERGAISVSGALVRCIKEKTAAFSLTVLDAALPARCLVSDALVGAPGQISPAVWGRIQFIAPPVCAVCGAPQAFDAGAGAVCGSCAVRAPVYDAARAVFVYDDASRAMILNYKHGRRMDGVAAYAAWMARAGADVLGHCALIAPVPLHYTRLIRRRFNQSAILAQRVGALAGRPVAVDLLTRDRRTASQFGKNWRQRRRNVAGVFSVRPRWRARLRGAGVLLVDDVLTTGATVEACAKTLKANGAAQVFVITLARTVALRRPA